MKPNNQLHRWVSLPLNRNLLKTSLLQKPSPYESNVGDLSSAYSRRINIKHRLVYEILDEVATVKVLRMWTHYK